MTTTHFGINAETMMCGHTIVEGGSDLWATDGTLVSCFESLRYMARAAAYAMRNPRTPSRVLKDYWGRSTSCLRERQAYYSRSICLLTCMNGTSWPDIVGVGRQFTGQFHKDPLYPQPARWVRILPGDYSPSYGGCND